MTFDVFVRFILMPTFGLLAVIGLVGTLLVTIRDIRDSMRRGC